MTTVAELVRKTARALEAAGIESAARDARALVAKALSVPAERITLMARDEVDEGGARALAELLPERLARKPLSHLTGKRAFWKHEFEVTADVLDPRPETEALVSAALAEPFETVLDLGTGSGAILLSLLAERPAARGVGADLSQAALAVAERNAARLGVEAHFVVSDWFGAIEGVFDLIVSNPPYIALEEMAGLAPELGHEPRMALTDEADGLTAYRAICAGASKHLSERGRLMVEIGWQQGDAVAALMTAAGLVDVQVLPDLDGRDRVVCARKAP